MIFMARAMPDSDRRAAAAGRRWQRRLVICFPAGLGSFTRLVRVRGANRFRHSAVYGCRVCLLGNAPVRDQPCIVIMCHAAIFGCGGPEFRPTPPKIRAERCDFRRPEIVPVSPLTGVIC